VSAHPFLKEFGPGVFADRLISNRTESLKRTVRPGTAGMDDALWNPLAIEVGDLFEQLIILHHRRPAIANGTSALIVVYRTALTRCQCRRRWCWSILFLRRIIVAVAAGWGNHGMSLVGCVTD